MQYYTRKFYNQSDCHNNNHTQNYAFQAEETNLKPHIVRSSNYGGPNSRKSSTLKSGRKRALAGEGWGPLQGPKVLLTEDKVRLGHNPLQVYTHLATSQKNYANNVKEINSFLNENQGSFSGECFFYQYDYVTSVQQ